MYNIFVHIYDWFEKRRILLYLLLIFTIGISAFYASQIKLQENISSFFDNGDNKESNILKNFKLKDRILIMVSGTDPDEMIVTAASVTDSVQTLIEKGLVNSITTGVNQEIINNSSNFIYKYLPIFLENEDYQRIEKELTDSCIQQSIERYYSMLTSPSGFVVNDILCKDPLNIGTHLLKKFERFGADFEYEIYDDHIFNKDMSILYMYLEPKNGMANTGDNEILVKNLEQICKQFSNNETKVECIGGPIVAVGNARQIKDDTTLTLILALLLIIPLLYLSFRNKLSLLYIILPPLFGALLALAIIAVTKNSISIIALGAGTVVFGISLSYSIHIISHNNHIKDAREIIQDLAYPLTVGCFTTIGAFVALMFTKSSLLQDMGLFASLTLIGTTLFSLVFLPHFLKYNNHNKESRLLKKIEKYNSYSFEKNKLLIISIALITIICLFHFDKVEFDSDMSSINFETPAIQEAEKKAVSILEGESQQIYIVTSGSNQHDVIRSYTQLHELYDTLKKESKIKKYIDVKDFIVADEVQKTRIIQWIQFWKNRTEDSMHKIVRAGKTYGFKENAFDEFKKTLSQPYDICNYSFDSCGQSVLNDWIDKSSTNLTLISKISISQENKDEVYKQINNIDNTTIIDRAYFSSKMIINTSNDFNFILLVTSCLVFFTLLITYGRIELALLTFLPMCISWVIILGIMSILNIKFNIVNIILATFIFGIGDDFSIFTIDGLLSKYKNGSKVFEAHKSAIFFSALTTIIGMGVLVFAKHPALHSIAAISVLGLCIVVIVSYTVQPFLFNLLILKPTQRGGQPYTILSCINTIYAFLYFTLGCFILNVAYILLKFIFLRSRQKQVIFHYLIYYFVKIFLKSMYMINIHYPNIKNINFNKPSVIIANHQSFVDILLLLSLSPKIVMVTKGWVWKSPIFGRIVQYAGFYTIEEGYEHLVDSLSSLVKEGYSIVVFPEGTRSEDCEIKRFHKGAFYLAEKLQLDITPLVIYGTGLISSKKQPFYIKNGEIIVKTISDSKGQEIIKNRTYQEKTKYYKALFQYEYDILKEQNNRATNKYYRKLLIKNYIYKGPVLEWYMRIKCKMDGYYNFWDKKLPRNAQIIDIGCGYGQLCFMLGLLSPKRNITGIDYDSDKVEIANHCFLVSENIYFRQGDMQDIILPESDVFIFNDSLHYVNTSCQKRILSHCISKLNPNGVILIREGDSSKKSEHKTIINSEIWSTRIIKFNKTEGPLNFIPSDWIKQFAQNNNLNLKIEQCDRKTSQTIYIITKP